MSNEVKISDTEITKSGVIGIYAQGPASKPKLIRNSINGVEGVAIRVHRGCNAKIKGCEIEKCNMGIEVVSSDPLIIMNTISSCIENGIYSYSKGALMCAPEI